MRVRALLLLAFLAVACRSRIQSEHPYDAFVGLGATGIPGGGVSLTGGQVFLTSARAWDLAFEMRGTIQSVSDAAAQDGEFFQVQAGVKQILNPGHARRPFLRFGATWFRATGDPSLIDTPGDYLGAYAGGGYEFDLSPHFTVSPDMSLNLVNGEQSLGFEFLPTFTLNLLFRF